MGVKIRTMWMTPFYLFFGVLVIYIFQSQINLNKLKGFTAVFIILFIFSPFAYAYVSITQTDKRTDYQGKTEAKEIQKLWKTTFWGYDNKIELVWGDEWVAGNLSYHLKSRPKWMGSKLPLVKGQEHIYALRNPYLGLCLHDYKVLYNLYDLDPNFVNKKQVCLARVAK